MLSEEQIERATRKVEAQENKNTILGCAILIIFIFFICAGSTWVLFTAIDKIYGGC